MPSLSRAKAPSAPDFADQAERTLWRLSLLLKEISQNSEYHGDKKEQPPSQAHAKDAPTGGCDGGNPPHGR